MKSGIHPNYVVAEVTCACGNNFTTRSTKPVIKLEICSACHPFYTGQQKLLDTAGRVERFSRRFAKTGGKMVERKATARAAGKASVAAAAKAPKAKVLTTAPKKAAPKKAEPAKKAA